MSRFLMNVGVLALTDSAPLVAAQRLEFFHKAGLDVHLLKQTSWATLRDKLIVGELQVAQMLSPMPIAIQAGFGGCSKRLMKAPLVLNRGGNGITVSTRLKSILDSLGPGETLGGRVRALRLSGEMPEGLTLGTVFPFSMHTLLLRRWMRSHDLDPEVDVRLRVVPPVRTVEALQSGLIDGFCVGEPYNSMAEEQGIGAMVSSSLALWPNAPEKIVGCTADWALLNHAPLQAFCGAVKQACHWLEQDDDNRRRAAVWLSEADYVNVPSTLIERALLATVNGQPFVRFDGGVLSSAPEDQLDPLIVETFAIRGDDSALADDLHAARKIFYNASE